MKRPGSPVDAIDGAILAVLAASAALFLIWPAFARVQTRSFNQLEAFARRLAGQDASPAPFREPEPVTGAEGTAKLARRAAFQVEKTRFTLDGAEVLVRESGDPIRALALIAHFQLLNFPADPKSPEGAEASAIVDWACAQGLQKETNNSYFVYGQAARHFLRKEYDESQKLIRTARTMPGFDSHLGDANRSETALNAQAGGVPGRRPHLAIDAVHPFNAMSLWLHDSTREAVKKYNQEKALDIALAGLSFGEKVWSDASSVRQAAAGRRMCQRVLRSMSKKAFDSAGWQPVEAEFLEFLDDIGERRKMNEFRETFSRLNAVDLEQWLRKTRMAQAELRNDSMGLSVYLSAVLTVCLAGWLVFRWSWSNPRAYHESAGVWAFAVPVGPGLIFWSSWTGGLSGTYLLFNLAALAISWIFVLPVFHRSEAGETWLSLVRSGVRGALFGTLLLWLAVGAEDARATQDAADWLAKIGTVPWAEQR